MKIFLLIIFYTAFSFSEEDEVNSKCLKENNINNILSLELDQNNYEICFDEARNMLTKEKTKKNGIALMTKFLNCKSKEYQISAIWELGQAKSPVSIDKLYKKGIEAIDFNNAEMLESIIASLLSLDAKNKILDLAKYSKTMRNRKLTNIIRNEYLAFTSGDDFVKMEKIAGQVLE